MALTHLPFLAFSSESLCFGLCCMFGLKSDISELELYIAFSLRTLKNDTLFYGKKLEKHHKLVLED